MIKLWGSLTRFLKAIGDWTGLLGLRLLLGWEFFESGLEKHRGENWFLDIQDKFPAPFNLLPTNVSWSMATWFELVGGVAIVVGLGTRFFAVSLFILTVVATAAVHWPAEWHTLAELIKGYAITDDGFGNFKLPLLFMAMLIPLILYGPGKLSLDAWIARRCLARV
ncbi:MAG: DoxX family protein [Rugosibacter sp.]|nr:DoxX family protein [Rugosibacter sp.]